MKIEYLNLFKYLFPMNAQSGEHILYKGLIFELSVQVVFFQGIIFVVIEKVLTISEYQFVAIVHDGKDVLILFIKSIA